MENSKKTLDIVCYRTLTNKEGQPFKKRTTIGTLFIDGDNIAINLDGACKLDSMADQWLTCFERATKPVVQAATVVQPTKDEAPF